MRTKMDIAVIGSNMIGLISYPRPKFSQWKPLEVFDARRECEGKEGNGILSPDDLHDAEEDIASCRLIVLQLENPLNTVYEAIALGRKYNVPVLLNPAPVDPHLELARIRGCDYIVLNNTELAMITRMPTSTPEDVRRAAVATHENDIENVIVILGGQGVLWISSSGEQILSAGPDVTLDTTSAGDAFVGCFSHHLVSTGNVERSLELALTSQIPSINRRCGHSSPSSPSSRSNCETNGKLESPKCELREGDKDKNRMIRARIRLSEGHVLWQFLMVIFALGLIPAGWLMINRAGALSWVAEFREREKCLALRHWGDSWGPGVYFSNLGQLFALVGGVLALAAIASSQFGSVADKLGRILAESRKSWCVALAMVFLFYLVVLVNFIWWVNPKTWSDGVLVLGGVCFSVLCVGSPWVLIAVVHEPVVEKINSRFERKKKELDALWEEYKRHSGNFGSTVHADASGNIVELYPRREYRRWIVLVNRIIAIVSLLFLGGSCIAGVLRGGGDRVEAPYSWFFVAVVAVLAVMFSSTLVIIWVSLMRVIYAFFMLSERVVNVNRRRWLDRPFRALYFVFTLIYGVPLGAGSWVAVWRVASAAEGSHEWAWLASVLSAVFSLTISFYFLAYFTGGVGRLCHPVLAQLPKRLMLCREEVLELSECDEFQNR